MWMITAVRILLDMLALDPFSEMLRLAVGTISVTEDLEHGVMQIAEVTSSIIPMSPAGDAEGDYTDLRDSSDDRSDTDCK